MNIKEMLEKVQKEREQLSRVEEALEVLRNAGFAETEVSKTTARPRAEYVAGRPASLNPKKAEPRGNIRIVSKSKNCPSYAEAAVNPSPARAYIEKILSVEPRSFNQIWKAYREIAGNVSEDAIIKSLSLMPNVHQDLETGLFSVKRRLFTMNKRSSGGQRTASRQGGKTVAATVIEWMMNNLAPGQSVTISDLVDKLQDPRYTHTKRDIHRLDAVMYHCRPIVEHVRTYEWKIADRAEATKFLNQVQRNGYAVGHSSASLSKAKQALIRQLVPPHLEQMNQPMTEDQILDYLRQHKIYIRGKHPLRSFRKRLGDLVEEGTLVHLQDQGYTTPPVIQRQNAH